MVLFLKNFIKRKFPEQSFAFTAYKSLIRNKQSYLHLTGWMQSLDTLTPKDLDGKPIPWMNFSIVKLLSDRLDKDQTLFEFGSGYSTLFYAEKVKSVRSVEYDLQWFNRVSPMLPNNVELVFQASDIDGEYCRTVKQTGQTYDVIVVDGRDRVNCIAQSIPFLSPRGIVILDDSHRGRYEKGIKHAKALGFRVLEIEGLKATESTLDRTSIIYRDNNCLNI